MGEKSHKRNTGRIVLLSLLTLALLTLAAGMVFARFGGFGTGSCADTKEFAKYAGSVADITVPEQVRIVALGEATHGNAEFQQLKLEVFKMMVERYGVRVFALEGDYGSCRAVNEYIHGGPGTAQEAAAAIGFTLYRTEQMAQLIAWMRDYNETAEEGEDLRFYGFDMQRMDWNYHFLVKAAERLEVDASALTRIWDDKTGRPADSVGSEQWASAIEEVKEGLIRYEGTEADVHCADILLQNCELGKAMASNTEGMTVRDKYMAENVRWILEREESLGNEIIFLAAHNGHIERQHTYGSEGKAMGNLLSDEFGEAYYAIGTDFYRSRCNLPKSNGKRFNHTFYSHDPLAKASKKCGYEISWLDFAKVPDNSALKQQIVDYTWMGSVGEGYTPFLSLLPMSYRVWASPAKSYDGMIFVAHAHPTAPSAIAQHQE